MSLADGMGFWYCSPIPNSGLSILRKANFKLFNLRRVGTR